MGSTTIFVENIKMAKEVSYISLRDHVEQLVSTYNITEPCGVMNL